MCVLGWSMIQLWTIIQKQKTNGNLCLKLWGVKHMLHLFTCLHSPQLYSCCRKLPPPEREPKWVWNSSMEGEEGLRPLPPSNFLTYEPCWGGGFHWFCCFTWNICSMWSSEISETMPTHPHPILLCGFWENRNISVNRWTNVMHSWPLSDLGCLWFALLQCFLTAVLHPTQISALKPASNLKKRGK